MFYKTHDMPKKILVCDDQEDILDLLYVILTKQGYQVVLTSNGRKIEAVIQAELPDLLLLDLRMPNRSGDQITQALKNDPGMRALPVLIISANSRAEEIAEKCGADGFIPKPFSIPQLLGTIRAHIGEN